MKPHVLIPQIAYLTPIGKYDGRYYSQEFVDTLVRARDNARKEGEEKIAKLDREIDEYKRAARACPSCSRIQRLEDENKALRAARDEESRKVLALTEERDAAIDVIRSLTRELNAERSKGPVYVVAWDPALKPGDALVCPPAEQTKLLEERRHMLDNLTATQKRCTELVEEVRAIRALYAAVVFPRLYDTNVRVIISWPGSQGEDRGVIIKKHTDTYDGERVWVVRTDSGAWINVRESFLFSE